MKLTNTHKLFNSVLVPILKLTSALVCRCSGPAAAHIAGSVSPFVVLRRPPRVVAFADASVGTETPLITASLPGSIPSLCIAKEANVALWHSAAGSFCGRSSVCVAVRIRPVAVVSGALSAFVHRLVVRASVTVDVDGFINALVPGACGLI